MIQLELNDWLIAWGVLALVLLLAQRAFGRAAGIVSGYFVQMAALHWIAAAIYALPNYSNLPLADVVSGLRISTYSLLGFVVGTTFVAWHLSLRPKVDTDDHEPFVAAPRRLVVYAAIGGASYLAMERLLGVATVAAVVAAGSGFIVIALSLACWNAAMQGKTRNLVFFLLLSSAFPFVTIVTQGFMGYGLGAAAVVFAFVASFYPVSWRTVAVGLVGLYFGLSLYVTYMRDREDIRQVVWGGAQTADRVDRVSEAFGNFEFFDPSNEEHLWRIDMRLNQNYMVGVAEGRLSSRQVNFANGETVRQAAMALVPRALWPDKPESAGSGDLVTRFTGIRFAEGTSVGIGQVMEWYINFGLTGSFFGFLLFGALLAWVDYHAFTALTTGNWSRFAQWFLPGVSMLQIGGSLVEVTASVGAAALVARMVAIALAGTHDTAASAPVWHPRTPRVREY